MRRAWQFVTLLVVATGCLPASAMEPIVALPATELATESPFTSAVLLPPDPVTAELTALRQRIETLETEPVGTSVWEKNGGPAGWIAELDYLNWTLRRQGLDFAIATDDSALAVGAGQVQNLEFGRSSGGRAALGYQGIGGWELLFRFTYFSADTQTGVEEPAGGNLWATRSHPNRNEEARTALAAASFNYRVYDLEANYLVLNESYAAIRILGGLRGASIDQKLQVDYDGRDFDNGVFRNPVSMTGFGVRMGLEGRWYPVGGWSVFGRGAGSVLYGDFRTRLIETNGADLIVDVSDHYQQAVPVAEAAVGLSWQCERLEIDLGYELVDWFQLGDRSMFGDSTHEGSYVPISNDILLDGVFVRCVVRF